MVWAYPPPYQSGVGLSGTLSTPLSLRYVQTTPTIPYARDEQSRGRKTNNHGICQRTTLFKSIVGKRSRKELKTYTYSDHGITHEFEYINNVVLNNSHLDVRVNFIHYTQTDSKGKKTVFSWITSINTLFYKFIYIF